MKIDKFPSTEDFCIKECTIGGVSCVLVFPYKMDVEWTEENKYFRSSIWTQDGELVSASFRKFTNLGEKPEFETLNEDKDIEYIHKIDGSALIISKFNGELIVRTRGTTDASLLENGHEIAFLKEKYSFVFDNAILNSEKATILCEWFSPKNIIVEREAQEPSLWLTGIIFHRDYSYAKQSDLDTFSDIWKIPRPSRYSFNTISEMAESVNDWKVGEGIVIYGNDGQVLKKAKSLRYLKLHKIKSQLNSEKNLIEFYVSSGMPDEKDFLKKIEDTFDWEIAEQLKDPVAKIVNLSEKVKEIISGLEDFVHGLESCPTRKEQARYIIETHGENNRSSFCFTLLDGKGLSEEMIIKIFDQVIEKE